MTSECNGSLVSGSDSGAATTDSNFTSKVSETFCGEIREAGRHRKGV